MDRPDLVLQRSCDGRLDQAQAAALERLLEADPALRAEHGRQEALDALLRERAEEQGLDLDRDAAVARVMAALPAQAPDAAPSFHVGQVAVLACVLGMMGLVYGLAGSSDDLLPLGLLALLSVVLGLVFVVLARPLRDLEAGVQSLLLHRRIPVGRGDVLAYRAVGVAMLLGAIWLMRAALG